jgi:hypothetical protein
MSIRRVVTGFDAGGAGAFVSDDVLDELQNSNTMLSSLWRTDGDALLIPPKAPVDDAFGFPAPGGAWVLAWSVPANSVAGEDGEDGLTPTKVGQLPSGGAHATDSIDVDIVLSGEVVLSTRRRLGEDACPRRFDRGQRGVAHVAQPW